MKLRLILLFFIAFLIVVNGVFAITVDNNSIKSTRKVVITPVPSYNNTIRTQMQTASYNNYSAEVKDGVVVADEIGPKSFGEEVKNGFVAVGKYSWLGIKKGSKLLWTGAKKGAYYSKVGTISFLEWMGVKSNPDEIKAHEDILSIANKTLIESRTKRELRLGKEIL